jgi:hypothetical protein
MTSQPQALEIIFEMQGQKSNEKITRKKKLFNLQNTIFFSPSLWTPLIFKPHNFLISYSFKTI